jgi:hypothetical protein
VKDKFIRQFYEIPARTPKNNAVKASIETCKYLESINHSGMVYIYGDPAGSARSTVDANTASFFDKFIEVMRQHGIKVVSRVKKSMPEIALSATFINEIYESNLYGYAIGIDESCVVSIEDYYTVKQDQEGKMQKMKRKDPATSITYEPYGHFSDAKRYFLMTILAGEFERYKTKANNYVVISK